MSGLNQVVLIGNLTRDPELRYTPDGTPVTSFTIAVNRPFINRQGEREADFVPIVVWRKRAETCSEYLMKGSQVAVEGRLQVRNYEDKDGIDAKLLFEKVKQERGKNTYYFPNFEKIIDFLKCECREGDIILTLGAGNIDEVGRCFLKESE